MSFPLGCFLGSPRFIDSFLPEWPVLMSLCYDYLLLFIMIIYLWLFLLWLTISFLETNLWFHCFSLISVLNACTSRQMADQMKDWVNASANSAFPSCPWQAYHWQDVFLCGLGLYILCGFLILWSQCQTLSLWDPWPLCWIPGRLV